jgi:protein TonB
VRPDYPQDALLKGTEGWVDVSMTVTPSGNVLDPRVEGSSNGTLFNRAALGAVRKWRYEPFAASEAQRVTVRVDFRMKDRR